jgi:hypothetical protein|tara:strand:+ start:139 stop:432 length:294 start_codon:yes stop_codon:yes gene_type:complete
MAVVVTNTWVRPNTEVDFYEPSESQLDYITVNFKNNDKYTVTSKTFSDDELTKIRVVSFADAGTRNEWKADSTVQQLHSERNTYCTNNSISHTVSVS